LGIVLISKREIETLSADVRRIIDGQDVDLRDNREGTLSLLKNDIHTLAKLKNEQVDALQADRDALKDALANISHQLKTPLTSMMIMADLLENDRAQDAPAPDKQAEFIANIKTGLARTEWLVSSLLKMAKLDAGAVEFTRTRVSARTLVELALEPLQILLDVKNQRVTVVGETELKGTSQNPLHTSLRHIDSQSDAQAVSRGALYCDIRWTAEALTNILKNASEYSPEGSEIHVESGENPLYAWLAVKDSGTGISNAEIARLFKRFESSRSEKGYGIGLPLALAIMRGQNGDIQVDGGGKSNGDGATFTLKFLRDAH
jgi:signal transduction histidine kinase